MTFGKSYTPSLPYLSLWKLFQEDSTTKRFQNITEVHKILQLEEM